MPPPTWTKGGEETEKSGEGRGGGSVSGAKRHGEGGARGGSAQVWGGRGYSGEQKREEKRWK